MKTKIILIIIALFAITKTYSQTYEPIVDTTKMWVVYEHGMDPFAGRTYAYKITSDSVFINNKYWHNVLISEDPTYSQWISYNNAKIREENKIVYYTSGVFSDVNILYNFNLNDSDTCFGNIGCEYIIDSVYNDFFAGKIRETQSIYWISDTIYSGIGSKEAGLFGTQFLTGGGEELVCYYQNDSLLYHNSNYDSCYIDNTTNNINILQKNVFEIYPNPSTGNVQLTMSNEQLKNARIEIVTITGKTVYTSSLQGTKQSIDLSKQAKGIYIIKLIGEGFVSTQKLVLE